MFLVNKKVALFLLVTLFASSLYSQVSLKDYIEQRGLELYWDELLTRGMLWRGDEMISFRLDSPIFSVNLRETKLAEALYAENGEILIPQETLTLLDGVFPSLSDIQFREVSTIFIDPGHGGKDPGTIGQLANGNDIYEKDIVLYVASNLAERLRQEYPDKQIVLSRDEDVYLTLEERTEMANSLTNGPDDKIVFISVHANASLSRVARGTEVWYLPPEYRRQLLDEDDVDDDSGTVLPILNTILEEEYTVESILLAQSIDQGLMGQVGDYTVSRGLKEMDWYVVRNASMPSVLVEVGFVTNSEEVELLNNPLYLQKLSLGIYNGITDFVQDFESVSR